MKCSHPGCGKTFTQSGSLNRHEKIHGEERRFQCPHCPKKFHRTPNMTRHVRICVAGTPVLPTPQQPQTRKRNIEMLPRDREFRSLQLKGAICGGGAPTSSLTVPRTRKRNAPTPEPPKKFKIYKTATAFRNATVTWKLLYKNNDPGNFVEHLDKSTSAMREKLQVYRKKHHALKFNMSLHVKFE